jgi:PPOX class probable F420-dependent enzyme
VAEPTPQPPRIQRSYGVPADTSGAELLPWSEAERWLAESRNFWICTTRRDGRPHASPVWGLWRNGALVFSCSRSSVKARNLARDPRVVVHTESGDDVVILEGQVAEVALDDEIAAEYDAKYGWRVRPDPASVWFRVVPASAQTWRERDYPKSAARWVF